MTNMWRQKVIAGGIDKRLAEFYHFERRLTAGCGCARSVSRCSLCFSPHRLARAARCREMRWFRPEGRGDVLDVRRAARREKTPQISAYRGPQQRSGGKYRLKSHPD